METIDLMLGVAMLPMGIGLALAFTLSRHSELSARTRARAAYIYQSILLISTFVFPELGWETQLGFGVLAAFGVGFSMSQWRLATTNLARVVPAILLLLYSALLFHLFRYELAKALGRLV